MNTQTIGHCAQPVRRPAQCLRLLSAALVAALISSTGCVMVPIPTREHTPMDTVTRQNVSANDTDWIQPGMTCMADILLKLGEPDQLSHNGRKLAYRWQKIRGYVVFGVPGGGGVEAWLKDYYLVIECDADGVVLNKQASNRSFTKASPQELFAGGGVTTGPVTDERISISGPAEWFAGIAGYDWLRNIWRTLEEPPKGVRGQLMLTANALYFHAQGQLLGGPPVLTLRFDGLSECRLDKYGLGRRLVVRATTGEVHTFTFWGARGVMEDAKTTGSAFEHIQSRIGP